MYRFFNPNPRNARVGDCTVRALSIATGQTWANTYIALADTGLRMADMPSSNNVWGAFLRERGFKRKAIPGDCRDDYNLSDFAEEHPVGVYVVATPGHVIAVVDGAYIDTWDSGHEIPLYYWEGC